MTEQQPNTVHASIKRTNEFMGKGCLFQALGLALLCGGFFLGIPGIIIGILLGLTLLIYGGRISSKWTCTGCGNQVVDKTIKVCPTCKAVLQ